MVSVNKQSLREEFDQLKKTFDDLSNKGKVTPEVGSLFQAMILLFELLTAIFLEKKTKKNCRNSSKPSSQTGKDETSKGSGTNGKGKEQNGVLSGNTRTVETVQVATVKDCEFCGEALDETLSCIPIVDWKRLRILA
jgi:transposase